MDNAEAIKRIKDHIRVHHIGEYPHIKIAEALNMAISALANDNNVGHKVEVVRCKDCKHWKPGDSFSGDSLDDMQRIGRCPIVRFGRREKDFCCEGERESL